MSLLVLFPDSSGSDTYSLLGQQILWMRVARSVTGWGLGNCRNSWSWTPPAAARSKGTLPSR